MTTFTLRESSPDDTDELFRIWLAAVRATHDFVAEEDISFYAQMVRAHYLPNNRFTLAESDRRILGFIGLSGHKILSLFVDPAWHGRGVGRRLIDEARRHHPTLLVDVNEQNHRARAFYARLGFEQIGRSPVDEAGRPYPLLHLVSR
ncbi:acetyltransferase [Telmatospirillum sp. J64-1]|uniref:acetyltransferase n=1 Tax=Telmatospirillum sp. J64-1 TaxID=2502183 RepID=UPI00115E679D|nr:acetyltransferase [Telmatospirillum sp. J64-1]